MSQGLNISSHMQKRDCLFKHSIVRFASVHTAFIIIFVNAVINPVKHLKFTNTLVQWLFLRKNNSKHKHK